MTDTVSFLSRGSIEEDAGYWLIRLDSGEISDNEKQVFQHWLNGDPRRSAVFYELQNVWRKSDALRLSRAPAGHRRSRRKYVNQAVSPKRKSPIIRWPAIAASVTLFVAVSTLSWRFAYTPEYQAHETGVGRRMTVSLEDSSVVELNTDTAIKSEYSDDTRTIRLLRGEAHFMVTPDKDRPFIVTTNNGRVRAVGTAFNVALHDDVLEVVVTEGMVEVAAKPPTPDMPSPHENNTAVESRPVSVVSGQKTALVNNRISDIENVGLNRINRELAWRRGVLIFQGEAFEDAVAEISRHTTKKIVIADHRIKGIQVGGTYPINDIGKTLAMLAKTYDLIISRPDSNTIILRLDKNPF